MPRDRNTGAFKGDALVSFLKAPSVTLAVNLLDGAPLRPGDNKNIVVRSHASGIDCMYCAGLAIIICGV